MIATLISIASLDFQRLQIQPISRFQKLDSFAVRLAQAHKPKSYFDVAPKLYEANPPPGTYDAKGLEIA